jgi:hypothetical protein
MLSLIARSPIAAAFASTTSSIICSSKLMDTYRPEEAANR